MEPGDLFLFFGLFRHVVREDSVWRFSGPPFHAIFGWLQVDEVVPLGEDGSWALESRPWLAEHPHVRPGWPESNTLYIGASDLSIGRQQIGTPGFGLFGKPIQLTAEPGGKVSAWRVPRWLDPTQGGTGMSYHPPKRWLGNGMLYAAARGQEFVAHVADRSDAVDWVANFFEST